MSKQYTTLKIVCRTDRALDNTTAVLDFIGYNEKAVSGNTIILNVLIWNFSKLIEIIHVQFSEELGERAYREEIDFYSITPDGKEEKVTKCARNDKAKKSVLHVVLGESPSQSIRGGSDKEDPTDTFNDVFKWIGLCDGNYLRKTFKSEDEKMAYIAGLEDGNGWIDFCVLEDYYSDTNVTKFEQMYNQRKQNNE